MSKETHHWNPLSDKIRMPWQQHHGDDRSDSASEKKLRFPRKHYTDDGRGAPTEKQPLLGDSSSSSKATPAFKEAEASNKTRRRKRRKSNGADRTISRTWNVKMPPSKTKMVNGMAIPTMEGTFGSLVIRRRRRIVVEIHSEVASNGPPPASLLGEEMKKDGDQDEDVNLRTGDLVMVKILKPVSKQDKGILDRLEDLGEHSADNDAEQWVTDYVFGLENVTIIKARGTHIEAKFGDGDETMIRHVHFGNEDDASSFQQILGNLDEMENALKQERLKNFARLYPSMVGSDKKHIRLLIEVVSASNLPDIANGVAPNPFVVVTLGSKEVHRTRPVHASANPIWTVDTRSLFILNVSPEEFFSSAQGLSFFVNNYDPISTNSSLGKAFVSQEKLLNGKGERKEYKLEASEIDTQLRPVTQGYNRLIKEGQGLVDGADEEIENVLVGERLHPVNDLRKLLHQDSSDDEEENDLDKLVLHPARKVERLVHGQDEGDGLRKLLQVGDPLNWIRNDANQSKAGKLVLRVRPASDDDVAFMDRLSTDQSKGITGIYSDETFVQPHVRNIEHPHKQHRKVDNEMQYRVKPFPDPDHEQATTWMTEAELSAEALKTSTKWIEAGSGDLGKLYVEIIGCSGLPNKDSKELGTGTTDGFACLVYEDAIVCTEVIKDTLNPWWMPWTQRAFIFNVMHPSSDLLVGVLDYDSISPGARHDPIGRIRIDVSQIRPGTQYIVDYNLYPSAIVKKRKNKGTITLRMRLELHDERKALLAAMRPPPQVYINVSTQRDYKVARFVVEGTVNVHVFNMDLFGEYVEQLKGSGLALMPILKDAAYTVIFWRGHYPVNFRMPWFPPLSATDGNASLYSRYTKSVTILLPLHSATAFVGAIFLVEDYNLFPSFLLFSIAWLFLAMSGTISHNPSPWKHQRTFPELMGVMLSNSSPLRSIKPNENIDEIRQYLAKKSELSRKLDEETKLEMEAEEKAQDSVGNLEAVKENAKVEMGTRTETLGISTSPMEYILWPMQENLRKACEYTCIARSFLLWEECYYCYWIIVGCIMLGVTVLFIPWGWLIRWSFRIGVWIFLGPWMKLADMYHTRRNETTDEARHEAEARVKAKYQALVASTTVIRTQEEDLTKLKEMEKYLFGNYLAVVPRFKQQRYVDFPLSSSYTAPPPSEDQHYDISRRVFGQQLTGEMIPHREIDEQGTRIND